MVKISRRRVLRSRGRPYGLIKSGVDLAAGMIPYGRQIVGAAILARRAAKALSRPRKRSHAANKKKSMSRGGKQWSGVSTHFYKGNFKKPRRKPSRGTATLTQYQSKGYLLNSEIFGRVDDADCVYVGHSTYDLNGLSQVISCSIIRKLFKKAGFDTDLPDQELPLFAFNNADGFRVQWERIALNGTIVTTSYVTVDGDNIRSVASASLLANQIREAMEANDSVNRGDFDRIALYSSDRNGLDTNWRLAAELSLKREVLDIYVKSELTVQNRTKSATTGNTSTDSVDNQPLKGYMYEFTGGVPTMKTMGRNGLNRIPVNGVVLVQAVDTNPAPLYREPPVPKTFSNCYKSSYCKLDPGSLKKTVIYSKWRGYFNNLIGGKLKSVTDGISMTYAPGKAQMLALEERLNSGSTNLITVNYEAQRSIGAVLYTTKQPVMLADFAQIEFNNVTP